MCFIKDGRILFPEAKIAIIIVAPPFELDLHRNDTNFINVNYNEEHNLRRICNIGRFAVLFFVLRLKELRSSK